VLRNADVGSTERRTNVCTEPDVEANLLGKIPPAARLFGTPLTRGAPGIGLAFDQHRFPMIIWRLCGVSTDFVCSIEKRRRGYYLVVRSGSSVVVDDVLPDIRRARWKADLIRAELLAMGYTAPALIDC
jgi:hypothetical protein